MPTQQEEREKRFDEKFPSHGFNNIHENEFHGQNLKAYIEWEISLAVAQREKEIVKKLKEKYGDGINNPALVIIESTESGVAQRPALEEIINLITKPNDKQNN